MMTEEESAVIFPLLPDKRVALREFLIALENRGEEHDATHHTVSHESWFLQETQEGDKVVVYLRASDTIDVYTAMALSQTPFAQWFREQVFDLTGVNLILLPPFSLPERIFVRDREPASTFDARVAVSRR